MEDNRSVHHHDSLPSKEHFTNLIQFRQAAYLLLGPARDGLFELTDANLQQPHPHSFVELSCAPAFHRQWSSVYEAIQDGRPNRQALMRLYLTQLPNADRLLLVGDHTAWPRLWAETLPGRAYQHQPTPIPGRRPVTIGYGYSTLAVVPELAGSWALPLLHERILNQKPVQAGGEQLRQVCIHLKQRPISLWDSEYGVASFVKATADIPADKLIRLRANTRLEGATKPYCGRGRHPKHGTPFKFSDPATWGPPTEVYEEDDPDFGPLVVRIWTGLRFGQALDCPIRVAQIERTAAPGTRRKPKILWLGWVGEEPPPQWWRLYTRRYPIDHWYRFAKDRLHWTLPRFATPEQADRWSDLMPLLTWEIWLGREWVTDQPLPWQKPQPRPTPGRVCQGISSILAQVGTPVKVCKPRGNAPGWPKGRVRTHRQKQELVRSEHWKAIRAAQQAKKAGETRPRGRPKRSADTVTA